MVDEVFDLDENSVYPSIIKPSYLFARGCGKSQIQLQLYDAIWYWVCWWISVVFKVIQFGWGMFKAGTDV